MGRMPGQRLKLALSRNISLLLLLVPILGALAALVVFLQMLEETRSVTVFVDVAGRHRMLAEQIDRAANDFSRNQDATALAALHALAQQFDASLITIEKGGHVPGQRRVLPPIPEHVSDMFNQLKARWADYRRTILMTTDNADARPSRIKIERALAGVHAKELIDATDNMLRAYSSLHDGRYDRMLALLVTIVLFDIAAFGGAVFYLRRQNQAQAATEAGLRRSERLLLDAQQLAGIGSWERDVRTDMGRWSDTLFNIFGLPPQATIPRSYEFFLAHVHPDDRARVEGEIADAREARRPIQMEYRIVRPDGAVRTLYNRTEVVVDRNGRLEKLIGIVQDVTDLRQAEAQRLAHERAQRDTLVREVHHRIKNNLQGVVGLLRQQADNSPDLRAPLEAVILQVNTVAVVHGLQGKRAGETLNLCDVAREVARAVVMLTGTPVEPVVERQLLEPVRLAESEAVATALILNELVVNAVKHRDRFAAVPVQVLIDLDDGAARVRVVNRGGPLPAGFDFTAGRGLGTGLTLVRALLPPQAASLEFHAAVSEVTATLRLSPPIVTMPIAAGADRN